MTQPGVSMTTQRTDRLLRSLVGVSDVRLTWNVQTHRLRAVHVLRDARTQPHQLIRNVVSGMHAAFGVELLPTQVHVHDDATVFEAIVVAADVLAVPVSVSEPEPVQEPEPTALPTSNGVHANGNGNGNGHVPHPDSGVPLMQSGNGQAHGNGNGGAKRSAHDALRTTRVTRPAPLADMDDDVPVTRSAAVKPGEAPTLRAGDGGRGLVLERIDLERRGVMIRCRTTLSLDGRTYSAIAEVPDSLTAEAEVAARVALDALRAGSLTNALLEGVGFITVAQTNYCVATVRESGRPGSRAGIAPLVDSLAASATIAVLHAIGRYSDVSGQHRPHA